MSTRDAERPVPARLVVESPDRYTEIFVIDTSFDRRAAGVGRLEAEIPPGLYKIKYKLGHSSEEAFVRLNPGETRRLEAPRFHFSSPAPLEDTRTTQERHMYPAAGLADEVQMDLGGGALLFVFTRWMGPGDSTPTEGPAATGVVLVGPSGEILADLGRVGEHEPADGWSAFGLRAPAGDYRLRYAVPGGPALEQALILQDGWQLQIFLPLEPGEGGPRVRGSEATVFMRREPAFEPGDEGVRLTEMARVALLGGRQVIGPSEMHDMLWAKEDNPILGLLGALLLSLRPEPDLKLLREVTGNLGSVLGATHPDVLALQAWLALRDADYPVPDLPVIHPPMTRRSWDLAVEAALAFPHEIPPGSMAEAVADRVMGGGVWLTWQAVETAPASGGVDLETTLPTLATALAAGTEGAGFQKEMAEAPVMQQALMAALPPDLTGAGPVDTGRIQTRLARQLGVPPSTVARAAAELAERLRKLKEG